MRSRCFVLLVLGLAVSAQASELDGTWIYEKEIDTRIDGTVVKLPGPEYTGVLIYTADGFVSATLMPRNPKRDLASLTGGATTAYAGRYTLDTVASTVTHLPLTSLDPADVGQKLVRKYRLSGDTLVLSGNFLHEGRQMVFSVHWKRATAADKVR